MVINVVIKRGTFRVAPNNSTQLTIMNCKHSDFFQHLFSSPTIWLAGIFLVISRDVAVWGKILSAPVHSIHLFMNFPEVLQKAFRWKWCHNSDVPHQQKLSYAATETYSECYLHLATLHVCFPFISVFSIIQSVLLNPSLITFMPLYRHCCYDLSRRKINL